MSDKPEPQQAGGIAASLQALAGVLRAVLDVSLPAKLARRIRLARAARLLRASPLFDAAWYLSGNPDVAGAGIDPAEHYLAHGAAEGRDPGPDFDGRFYVQAHQDVAKAGMNPLMHYILHGQTEQRAVKPSRRQPGACAPDADTAGAPAGNSARHAAPRARSSKRPLVLCPAADWAVSGVHTATENIGKALRGMGWDFRIVFTTQRSLVTASANGKLPDLPHDFLPIAHMNGADFTAALAAYVSKQTPCILLCGCDFRANAVAPHLPEHTGVFVYSQSDDEIYYNQSMALSEACYANICVSRAIEENVRRIPGLTDKAHYIPNCGLRKDEVLFRNSLAMPELSCVYTGRLIQHQKRIHDFVHLARCLDQTGRPYQLSLIGSDFNGAEAVLRRELAAQIRCGSVRLPGRMGREEILQELDRHNFFLLLSEFEGFSLSLAEAMGRGCVPVVTSITSGNSDIVRSGHNGMVMPHRDYERWAAWLDKASRDESAWLEMSRAASGSIHSSFTVELQAEKIDALLRAWWKRA